MQAAEVKRAASRSSSPSSASPAPPGLEDGAPLMLGTRSAHPSCDHDHRTGRAPPVEIHNGRPCGRGVPAASSAALSAPCTRRRHRPITPAGAAAAPGGTPFPPTVPGCPPGDRGGVATWRPRTSMAPRRACGITRAVEWQPGACGRGGRRTAGRHRTRKRAPHSSVFATPSCLGGSSAKSRS